MKICHKCGYYQELSQFTGDSSNKDNLSHKCKSCQGIMRQINKIGRSSLEVFNEWIQERA